MLVVYVQPPHSIQQEIRELSFRSITRGFSLLLLDMLLVEVSRNICWKARHAHFDASCERKSWVLQVSLGA
jgi:hypothetical protein